MAFPAGDAMMHKRYHVFLSYSRKDNDPDADGWVTAFERWLKQRHRIYSNRDLEVFFDKNSIDAGHDWRGRLMSGMRDSSLFIAFLSPNYIVSENCLWEWEQYLRREHSAARGDDGITPIFFVKPGDLTWAQNQAILDWLDGIHTKYPWFTFDRSAFTDARISRIKRWLPDLDRRDHKDFFDLQPWFEQGPALLAEFDAADRLAGLKVAPRDSATDDLQTLADRLDALDKRIAARLDRLALADLAPGNVTRSHEHFVGRHAELMAVHRALVRDTKIGLIAAAFSPGGLGKTAVARQYAHAYAEFYAAGGTWEIPCEGVKAMGAALLKLADDARFQRMGQDVGVPLVLSDSQRGDYDLAAGAVTDYIESAMTARLGRLQDELRRHPEHHSPDADLPLVKKPMCLLILDNVDQADLLSADQVALLPRQPWLAVLVTTRNDPTQFGLSPDEMTPVEVPPLPEADAMDLLREFQPNGRFSSDAEDDAARRIVRELGGYTLAIELVGAYLGVHTTFPPSRYLAEVLLPQGAAAVELLQNEGAVARQTRYKEKFADVLNKTLASPPLSPQAMTVLKFASPLQPDEIPLLWLQALAGQIHPELLEEKKHGVMDWPEVWRELRGLRLLNPAGEPETVDGVETVPTVVRIHRLIAGHVSPKPPAGSADPAEPYLGIIDQFLENLGTTFEQQVGQGEDAALRAQHPWLRDQTLYLLDRRPSATLLRQAGVAATYEGQHSQLVRAMSITEKVLRLKRENLNRSPGDAELSRDVSVSLNKLGNFYAARGQAGDAEAALRCFEESHEVLARLRRDNPQSAGAARDVSVSLNKLGGFYVARGQAGDAEAALRCFEESHEVLAWLQRDNPQSAGAARDVSVSLNKLGDFYVARGQAGDAEAALRCFEESHEVLARLRRDNPQSAGAARDVSVSLNKLGGFYVARGQAGDAEAALRCFEESLEVARRLRQDNPQSAGAARDVSVSLNKLGGFYIARGQAGDAEAALRCFEESHEFFARLRRENPQSAGAARDMSVSLVRLGDFLRRRNADGDLGRASSLFAEYLTITEQVAEANPQSGAAAKDVALAHWNLAQLRAQSNEHEQMAAHLAACYGILDGFARAGRPMDVQMRRMYDELKQMLDANAGGAG